MAVEDSILTSVKKVLGNTAEDTSFEQDLIMHINSVFMILMQLGVGPKEGFSIEDDTATWSDFFGDADENLQLVKSYMCLRVRLLFDPPSSSYVLDSFDKQAKEFEWRLNVEVDPKRKEEE